MPKKKIGLRGDLLKKSKEKSKEMAPLATTGERRIREGLESFWDSKKYPLSEDMNSYCNIKLSLYSLDDVYCLEVYEKAMVDCDKIEEKWYKEYPPEGYGTNILFGKSKDGKYFLVLMTRHYSCD